MKCPVCSSHLSPYSYGGQTIDVCPECHGIWFDPTELSVVAKEMIQKGQIANQEARDAFNVMPKSIAGDELEKMCPRCGVPTKVFNYSYDSNVFLNRCTMCQGVWTDTGELERIAKCIKGNPAVNRYAESLTKELTNECKQSMMSRLLKSRILSGIVALLYLAGAIVVGDLEIIWKMAMFLILPLACIWLSDAMGGYSGLNFATRPAITRRTPGVFIAFGGWLVLLYPLVLGIIHALK